MIILTDKMLVIPAGISPNYISENKPSLEDKSVEITQNGDYNYTASTAYYGIGNFNVKVNVQIPVESEKTIYPSFNEDITVLPSEGFDAISSVIVKKAEAKLQNTIVEITQNGDYSYTAGPKYYGIGNFNVKVNVQNFPVESEKTVYPSFEKDITVLPSEGFDAMSSVIVKKAEAKLENKNVEITENGYYNFSKSAPYDGIGNLNVNVNVQEKEIRYAIRPTTGSPICPFTNILLNETSWVSLDFAMDAASLSKEKAYLFGISASSLYCYLHNSVLHMYSEENVTFNKQITLDTNKHTLEFGFVSKADASGYAEFKVVFDGEVIADTSVLVPKYNLPLSLFNVPNVYVGGTYDDYIAGGGITYLVNNIGYTSVNNSVFDLFSLTVYDKPAYYRQTIHAFTPSVDSNNKPFLIDNITGEYQYPASGTYSYDKIDGDTRTEIASATYTMPMSNDFQYFRPSESAIVPTDIELPALHRITMYIKDIDSFEVNSNDGLTMHDALNVVKSRVMIGAQPVLVAPFNHIDYEKQLPRLPINDEHTAALGDSSTGLFNVGFEVYSTYTYSIYADGGPYCPPQALPSLKGEHTIKFGQRVADIHNIKTFFMLDDNKDECFTIRGLVLPDVITKVNENKMTPLCIFGTYNFVEGTKPDYVIALGYENALTQIGYTTGVRYAVKQIDIEEYPLNSDDINTQSTLRHRLVTLTDSYGVNCLFDTITCTPYYPYNGTLNVYTGPVEPEPPVDPEPPVTPDISEVLTNTYVKPSAGAIVPTDIKFTSLTNVTMHVKGFDSVNVAESNMDSRAMIGAQPNFIVSPFSESYSSSNIGIYFNGGGNDLRSTETTTGNTPGVNTPETLTKNGEHVITIGYEPQDINKINTFYDKYMWKIISIDEQGKKYKKVGDSFTNGVYKIIDNQMTTPICIFGNYNNSESMTPDDVIALGYENALNQIGYVTGTRYGLKQIDITVYNTDGSGSMTTTHSLVPYRDKDGIICLYDTITEKSYYPFHGTLDII